MLEMNLGRRCNRAKVVIGDLLRGDGLRAKAMRGGTWLGAGSVAEQALRFARNMILTRLLAPGAFGAMAIVMSCSAIVGTLTVVYLVQVGLAIRAATKTKTRRGYDCRRACETERISSGPLLLLWLRLILLRQISLGRISEMPELRF